MFFLYIIKGGIKSSAINFIESIPNNLILFTKSKKDIKNLFYRVICEVCVMSIKKDKVNTILVEFQEILKKYRPNTSELQLITSKISQMTARNIEKQFSYSKASSPQQSKMSPSTKPRKKWHKIKID